MYSGCLVSERLDLFGGTEFGERVCDLFLPRCHSPDIEDVNSLWYKYEVVFETFGDSSSYVS